MSLSLIRPWSIWMFVVSFIVCAAAQTAVRTPAFAAGNSNTESEFIGGNGYAVVLKSGMKIDTISSSSVCGTKADGTRQCAGFDPYKQGTGDTVSKLQHFTAGEGYFCGRDERGVRCWNYSGKFEKPIQEILSEGLDRNARANSGRLCVPQKDTTIKCYQPERQRWIPGVDGAEDRLTTETPPMESFGPFPGLTDFALGEYGICALSNGKVECQDYPSSKIDPSVTRIPVPSELFPGARGITISWDRICILSDNGLMCQTGRGTDPVKIEKLEGEWKTATGLRTYGYQSLCAAAADGSPLCISLDSSDPTGFKNEVPAEFNKPELKIKRFDASNDFFCAETENKVTKELSFGCVRYSTLTEYPTLQGLKDFEVSDDGLCGLASTGLVHCYYGPNPRPVPLPEDGSPLFSAGSCRWNSSRFHCSTLDLEAEKTFSDIKKVIGASLPNSTQSEPCIIFENEAGARAVRCFGSAERLATEAPPVDFDTTKIVASYESACLYGGSVSTCWGQLIGGENPPNLNGVKKILFGSDFACAHDQFGFVCWGRELTDRNLAVPAALGDLESVVDFAVGESHVCAISRENRVLCWGSNQQGQLDVPPLTNPTSIAIQANTTCASSDEGVTCWGYREDALNPKP